MKMKLTILSAVILVGIGSTLAIASREDHDATDDKPVATNCCAMKGTAPTTPDDKDAAGAMSCHSKAPVAKEGAASNPKGCCK